MGHSLYIDFKRTFEGKFQEIRDWYKTMYSIQYPIKGVKNP